MKIHVVSTVVTLLLFAQNVAAKQKKKLAVMPLAAIGAVKVTRPYEDRPPLAALPGTPAVKFDLGWTFRF